MCVCVCVCVCVCACAHACVCVCVCVKDGGGVYRNNHNPHQAPEALVINTDIFQT